MPSLKTSDSLLAVIDVQGKLARIVHESEALHACLQRLIRCARLLGLPVLWAEQNPSGLGPTTPEIAELLAPGKPVSKTCFSCAGSDAFFSALSSLNRRQVLAAGMEAHVCVYQSVSDLLRKGYEVHVITDAVSSRSPLNRQIGLDRMKAEGAVLSSVEMAVFELLRDASHPEFREIVKILK